MGEFLDKLRAVAENYSTPPPMPPEAVPPGLLGKLPIMHTATEIVWRQMGFQMFCNGLTVGGVGTVVVFAAIVFRGNLKALLVGAIKNALG